MLSSITSEGNKEFHCDKRCSFCFKCNCILAASACLLIHLKLGTSRIYPYLNSAEPPPTPVSPSYVKSTWLSTTDFWTSTSTLLRPHIPTSSVATHPTDSASMWSLRSIHSPTSTATLSPYHLFQEYRNLLSQLPLSSLIFPGQPE